MTTFRTSPRTNSDANRWKEIYELNTDVIGDNPDMIHPGQKLKLPE
ncbi:MAG: LysM peptidoglycan-binding domain-containing protein [Chloroflexota bacterium]|nr:LysM peptidoglycan-binding domain-containing protein [Chloroflexota bacterium]